MAAGGGGGVTRAGGLLQPEEHFKCESSGSSCRLLLNKRALRSVPPRKQSAGVPSWCWVSGWGVVGGRGRFLLNVQIFTAPKRIKLMEPRTQKISGEMNCTTKARSICTDKSMKNGAGKCSACTGEQVNCPFCLLWESNFFPNAALCVWGLG